MTDVSCDTAATPSHARDRALLTDEPINTFSNDSSYDSPVARRSTLMSNWLHRFWDGCTSGSSVSVLPSLDFLDGESDAPAPSVETYEATDRFPLHHAIKSTGDLTLQIKAEDRSTCEEFDVVPGDASPRSIETEAMSSPTSPHSTCGAINQGLLPEQPTESVPPARFNNSVALRAGSKPAVFGAEGRKIRRTLSKIVRRTVWSKRFFLFSDGRMTWGDEASVLASRWGAPPLDIDTIDFALTPCSLVIDEENLSLAIMPLPGTCWSCEEQHSFAGTQRPFMINIQGLNVSLRKWKFNIVEHLRFGLSRSNLARTRAAAFKVVPEEELGEEDCPICLEPLRNTDSMDCASETACGHRFHARCGKKWLKKDTSCPVCRTILMDGCSAHRRRRSASRRRHTQPRS